jgi:glycosyltransferase involved in cell wall biosynthesis
LPNRFGYFGNLSEHKGVLVLLEAAKELVRRDADARLMLNGGFGHAGAAFEARFQDAFTQAYPLAHHLGPYAREDVQTRMAQIDWVVIPSIWWENAPLVIEEARIAGKPVICSDIGGMAEVVQHGKTGLRVPPCDPLALADCMQAVSNSPELWRRLSLAGSRPHCHSAFVDVHLALFESLLGRVPA